MASKAATKKKTAKGRGRKLADRVADAALLVAGREGWGAVQPARIAAETGVSFGEIIAHYPTSNRIVAVLMRRIDDTVLAQVTNPDDSESPKDRLFEILMLRFDALQASRSGYVEMIRACARKPGTIVLSAPMLLHSMGLMMIACGLNASGLRGMARVHALSVAYASVLRVWVKDESPDLEATMVALDESLGRLERLESMVSNVDICASWGQNANSKNS